MQPFGCPAPPPAPHATPDPTTPQLALAVWPPSSPNLPSDYLASSRHHLPPELAARAVLAYTDPGDLVLDPDCACGSVVIEAIRHGRRAIGLTSNTQDGALAIANISHARDQGAPGRAAILNGQRQQLPRLLRQAAALLDPVPGGGVARHPAGSVRLILTKPEVAELPDQLPALRRVLAPGGFLLLALDHKTGETPTGLGAIVAAAEERGLEYWQHVIALRIQPRQARLAHSDVLAFRKPTLARPSQTAAVAVSA